MNKTKRSIFEAAIKVFSLSGYNGATMDEIALKAGVAKGTLYYHFKSKEEIFNFIISEGIDIMRDELKCSANLEGDPLERLRAICKAQLSMLYKNRDFFKVIMSQLWGQELRQLELRNKLEDYIKEIQVFFEEAMNHKVIKNADPSFVSYAFFGSLCSVAVYEIMKNEDVDVNEALDDLMQYTLNGIKA